MKKIFIFMLVLTALCLIVSCGEASDTTVAVTGDTTAEPHTAVTTTETVITTREPLTTPSATTTVVTVKTPETTEDDGMYRAGFEMTDKLMVVVTYVAYEIPREVSVLAEKIPITLYFGVPAASLNLDVFPKDTKFVFALKTEAQETLCTIGELTLDELKAGNYICTTDYETGKINYVGSGMTCGLDPSLFSTGNGRYLIAVEFHSEQAKDGWYDRYLGMNLDEGWYDNDYIGLPYSKESSKNAYYFGVNP